MSSTARNDESAVRSATNRSIAVRSSTSDGGRPSNIERTIDAAATAYSALSRSNGTPRPNDRRCTVGPTWCRREVRPRRLHGVDSGAKRSVGSAEMSLLADRARVSRRAVTPALSGRFLSRTSLIGLRSSNDNAVITSPQSHDMWWSSSGIGTRRHQMWWSGRLHRVASTPLEHGFGDVVEVEHEHAGWTARKHDPGRQREETEQQ